MLITLNWLNSLYEHVFNEYMYSLYSVTVKKNEFVLYLLTRRRFTLNEKGKFQCMYIHSVNKKMSSFCEHVSVFELE